MHINTYKEPHGWFEWYQHYTRTQRGERAVHTLEDALNVMAMDAVTMEEQARVIQKLEQRLAKLEKKYLQLKQRSRAEGSDDGRRNPA